jgi:hypothetical protein
MVGRNWDTTKISLKIGKTFAFSKKNQEIVVNLTNCQLLTGGGYNKRGYPYRYFQNTPRCTAATPFPTPQRTNTPRPAHATKKGR